MLLRHDSNGWVEINDGLPVTGTGHRSMSYSDLWRRLPAKTRMEYCLQEWELMEPQVFSR